MPWDTRTAYNPTLPMAAKTYAVCGCPTATVGTNFVDSSSASCLLRQMDQILKVVFCVQHANTHHLHLRSYPTTYHSQLATKIRSDVLIHRFSAQSFVPLSKSLILHSVLCEFSYGCCAAEAVVRLASASDTMPNTHAENTLSPFQSFHILPTPFCVFCCHYTFSMITDACRIGDRP